MGRLILPLEPLLAEWLAQVVRAVSQLIEKLRATLTRFAQLMPFGTGPQRENGSSTL